jgi:hypothetical protein
MPPQVTEGVRTLGVVACQQLLDPPYPKCSRGRHVRDPVALGQQPDGLEMARRLGLRGSAQAPLQFFNAQVPYHMRHCRLL